VNDHHNNIAWKNVTVVDDFPGVHRLTSIGLRNVFNQTGSSGLRFANAQEIDASFFRFGRIFVDLKPELFRRWRAGGAVEQGVRVNEEVFFPIPVRLDSLHVGRNVIAVEVHQDSINSEDLSFDRELSANSEITQFPPDVAFASPINGALFQTGQAVPVQVEALDSDGQIASVSLFADGALVSTDSQAPYVFQWPGASLGSHRLRALAIDNDHQQTTVDLTVTVLSNLPPLVELTQPPQDAVYQFGQAVQLAAQASDPGGAVQRVEFYIRQGESFNAPTQLVSSVASPPYMLTLTGLAPEHYMLIAVAVDNGGATTPSTPVHFSVAERAQGQQQCIRANPTVTIQSVSPSVFPGNLLTFTITVTNHDSPACPPSTFNVMLSSLEDGFVHTPTCVRLTLAPGETGSRVVTVRLPGSACAGPRTLREVATNESAPGLSGTADINFTMVPIVPACGRAAPTVTITPTTQEAPAGSQLTDHVNVTNNDDPACGGSDFIVTPALPAGLIRHTPSRFVTFIAPGGSASRDITVRSNLLVSSDLVFTETATHTCATSSIPAGLAVVKIHRQRIS
jgi:Bacterial Ig domain